MHTQAAGLLEIDNKTLIFWKFLLYVYNGHVEGLDIVWTVFELEIGSFIKWAEVLQCFLRGIKRLTQANLYFYLV